MKRPEIHTSKEEGNKSLTIRNIVERLTISSTSINIYLKKKSLPYINYRVRKINYLFHIYCFHVAITYIKLSTYKIIPYFPEPLSLSLSLSSLHE